MPQRLPLNIKKRKPPPCVPTACNQNPTNLNRTKRRTNILPLLEPLDQSTAGIRRSAIERISLDFSLYVVLVLVIAVLAIVIEVMAINVKPILVEKMLCYDRPNSSTSASTVSLSTSTMCYSMPELVPIRISLNSVDCTNAAYHASEPRSETE